MMTAAVTDAVPRPPPAREQTDGPERRLFGGLNLIGMAGVFRVPRRPVIRAVRLVCRPTRGATTVLATVEPCLEPDPGARAKPPRHRPACPGGTMFPDAALVGATRRRVIGTCGGVSRETSLHAGKRRGGGSTRMGAIAGPKHRSTGTSPAVASRVVWQ